ncbi:MAG TPA: acyltransferase, partial [Ilumatobacteraceae bacterium]|nr:acyltransferase [Ilumatobacteraceae bacterium]
MTTVVGAALFAVLFAWWWVNKPSWSGNEHAADSEPSHSAPSLATPPALQDIEPATGFRPDIEGLRALAVLMVLGYHARFGAFAGGFIGVDVFFVISGYLITALLLREMATTGTVSLANFWARRARRLLPASGLVLLFTLAAGRWLLDGLTQIEVGRDAVASAAFVANIRFWKVGTDYLSQ